MMRTHIWPRVVSDIVSGVRSLGQSPPPPPSFLLVQLSISADVSCGGTQSKAGIRISGTRTFRMPSFNFRTSVMHWAER